MKVQIEVDTSKIEELIKLYDFFFVHYSHTYDQQKGTSYPLKFKPVYNHTEETD